MVSEFWICLCDCSCSVHVSRDHLIRPRGTRSCGCLAREMASKRLRRHGLSKVVEHATWCGMITRCTDKNRPSYAAYGGRGIKVCPRWLVFENFYADMGQRPSPSHSLDRRDNNGDYEPDNCRWATPKEQSTNTRKNVQLTYDGITKCLSEWSRVLGFKAGVIGGRLRRGWAVERALSTPVLTINQVSALGHKARAMKRLSHDHHDHRLGRK